MLRVWLNTEADESKRMGKVIPERIKQTAESLPAVTEQPTSNVINLHTGSWERGERMFRDAERKFDAYLARRRKKGEQVRVLMRPYRTGQVCAILKVNGSRMRVYFCESQDGWRKA